MEADDEEYRIKSPGYLIAAIIGMSLGGPIRGCVQHDKAEAATKEGYLDIRKLGSGKSGIEKKIEEISGMPIRAEDIYGDGRYQSVLEYNGKKYFLKYDKDKDMPVILRIKLKPSEKSE